MNPAPRRRVALLVSVVAAFAMLASACGGSGSESSKGSGSDGPVAMGPEAVFTSTNNLSDPPTVWEGKLLGVVKTDTSSFNSESGTCLVVLGVTRATSGPDMPNSMIMREIVMKVNGEILFADDNKCDTQAVRDAGYDWLIKMDVPLGTDFPFFDEFFIPGVDNASPESVMYGPDTAGLPSTSFQPTILSTIPAPS